MQTLEQAAALAGDEDQLETAIDILQEAYELAEESGEQERAIVLLEQAITFARKLENIVLLGALLNNLALTEKRAVSTEKAKETQKQAIKLLEHAGAGDELGTAWNNLGFIERDLGNLQSALECYQRALPFFQQTRNSNGVAQVLLGLGLVRKDLGQLSEARVDLEQALALLTGEEMVQDRGHALSGLGLTLQLLNDYQGAQRRFEEALAAYQQVGDRENEAVTLHSLGQLYDNKATSQEEIEKALSYYLQSLKINQEIGSKMGTADNLGSIAALYQENGEYQRAFELHKQALRLYTRTHFLEGQLDTLVDLGIIARQRQDFAEAEKYLTKAVSIARKLGNPRQIYEAYLHRGELYLIAHQLHKTIRDHEAAVAAGEIVRNNLLLEGAALGFFNEPRLEAYDRLVRLYVRGLHQPGQALAWAERAKSREFLRRLSISNLSPTSPIPNKLLQREMKLLARLREIGSTLIAPGASERHNALQDYEQTLKKLQAVWSEIEQYDGEYVDLRRGEPISWKERRGLLKTGEHT